MLRKYAEIFCWKNVSSFCSAKATHIFSAKNFRILYTESAKTVNEMTFNELVKLTTLWTTGPWYQINKMKFETETVLSNSIKRFGSYRRDNSTKQKRPNTDLLKLCCFSLPIRFVVCNKSHQEKNSWTNGYSSEVSQWGTSNEHPKQMFLWNTGENYRRIIIKYHS